MRILSTRLHGVLDYLMAILLIVSPFVFNFARDGAQMWIPIFLGVATLFYSLVTEYELGAVKLIPFRVHLLGHFFSGMFLMASPFIFEFYETIMLPHILLGLTTLTLEGMFSNSLTQKELLRDHGITL